MKIGIVKITPMSYGRLEQAMVMVRLQTTVQLTAGDISVNTE